MIRNIPRDITEEYIRFVFQPYGQVLRVSIPRNQDKTSTKYGTIKGYAFVKMYNHDQAVHALNGLNNKLVIHNKYISVEFAKHSKK
jgi:RNA recognition motif-containing protein